ncbi:MAG: phosphoribosyltransferase family protein [Clostridia bacterium]|nr:phosphoribosyltransferase family protein [Clostridia bacterium]
MNLSKLTGGLVKAFFPPDITCICCNGELATDAERKYCICEGCEKDLENISWKVDEIDNESLYFANFYTVFSYSGAAKKLIVGFKDGNRPYLGDYMARLMSSVYEEKNLRADCVVYVPSSAKKIAVRGYDHMKIIADSFAKRCGLPVIEALRRVKQGEDQTQSTDRYGNIKGQFEPWQSAGVRGKRALLLDDVVTTGATASECSRLLLEAKAEKVTLLTFAEAGSFAAYKVYAARRMAQRK